MFVGTCACMNNIYIMYYIAAQSGLQWWVKSEKPGPRSCASELGVLLLLHWRFVLIYNSIITPFLFVFIARAIVISYLHNIIYNLLADNVTLAYSLVHVLHIYTVYLYT